MTDAQQDFDVDELAARIAAEALPAWNLNNAGLELISVSENLAFRVDDREHNISYVLRVHRPGYHTLAELESEQMWTSALNEAGIAVPTAVKTSGGQGYVPITMSAWEQPRYIGMARWLDGSLLSKRDAGDIADRYRVLGGVMAAMHNQAVAWQPPDSFTRHSFDADGLMGDSPFWGPFWQHPTLSTDQRSLLAAVRQVVQGRLAGMSKSNGSYSMIHADLHDANVLVHGDELRVIDFDDAGFGFHQYDIAVALYRVRDRDNYVALRDAMIEGYQRVRPKPALSLDDLPMFVLIRALALLGWIDARPEIDQTRLPEMTERACSMAAEFLDSGARPP